MQHDLVDVLRNPLRFAKIKARNMLNDPLAIPGKSLSYARYDVVRVLNSLMEALRLDQSSFERLVAKAMSVPAKRFLRSRRVSFLAAVGRRTGRGPPRARPVPEPDPGPVAAGRPSDAADRRRARAAALIGHRRYHAPSLFAVAPQNLLTDKPQRHRDTETQRRQKQEARDYGVSHPDIFSFFRSSASRFSVSLCLCGPSVDRLFGGETANQAAGTGPAAVTCNL